MDSLDARIRARYAEKDIAVGILSCGSNLDHLDLQKGVRVLDHECDRGDENLQMLVMEYVRGEAVRLDLIPEKLLKA